MKKLISLLIGLGCAIPLHSQRTVKHYKGQTIDYYVEASETFRGDMCVTRKITLKPLNKLHSKRVFNVVAIDNYCNDTIDDFRFKYGDKQVDLNRLQVDILFAFYGIKYGGT